MSSDNHERIRMEEALRESEARFRALFDQANDAIFMLHEGVFSDCNAKAQRLLGRSRDQILGVGLTEFSPPVQPDGGSSQDKIFELIHRALTGEALLFEWTCSRPDGLQFDLEISLSRLELVGKVHLQAIARDITGRKREEENKVRSLALLRATLDSTGDGILTIGADRQILSFNGTFAKMWRLPSDVLAAKDDYLALQCVLDQLEKPEQFLAKVHHLYDHPLEESFDVLEFIDGRIVVGRFRVIIAG